MSHDFTQDQQYFSDNLVRLPEPDHDADALEDIDPSFVFEFTAYDEIRQDGQRWSTWYDVEPLCRGPEPRLWPTAKRPPARRPRSSCRVRTRW